MFMDPETVLQALPTLFLLLSDFQCTKAFSLYNRSSLNLECPFKTMLRYAVSSLYVRNV